MEKPKRASKKPNAQYEDRNRKDELATLSGRLHRLRDMLSTYLGVQMTQMRVSEDTGVGQNHVHRLENQSGSMATLFRVVSYYHSLGVNVNWIFASDNTDTPIFEPERSTLDVKFIETQLSNMQQLIVDLRETLLIPAPSPKYQQEDLDLLEDELTVE